MKLAIVHLSDIHFKKKTDFLLKRVKELAAAIRQSASTAEEAVLVITGDVAFSGRREEYHVASNFLSALTNEIGSSVTISKPIICVPGNHDCDFSKSNAAREGFVNNPSLLELVNEPTADWSIVDLCTDVQKNFYNFCSKIDGGSESPEGAEKLRREYYLEIKGKRVRFDCYNSAWVSQLKEKQGRLVFPVKRLPNPDRSPDLVVAVFHHPYTWLESGNGRAFRQYVEDLSDLVLTGHEHEGDVYAKASSRGGGTVFVEGEVLQDDYTKYSAFNVITIDFNTNSWRTVSFGWADDLSRYNQTRDDGDWKSFERAIVIRKRAFENSETFTRYLSEPGAAFNHPQAGQLQINDIFVFPDFEERSYDRARTEGRPEVFRGVHLIERIRSVRHSD